MDRLRGLLAGPLSVALVVLMFAGCLFLWVGIPLIWLWIGSQIQAWTSLGTALAAAMAGVIVSVIVVVTGLSWVNHRHALIRESRNIPPGDATALEVLLVYSAAVALVCFGVWFFVFAGASPIPLDVGGAAIALPSAP
jgi:uncharacterized membrane protein YbhN (UPF0104 family)